MGNAALIETLSAAAKARQLIEHEQAGMADALTPSPLGDVCRNLTPSVRRLLGGMMVSGRLSMTEIRAADRWCRDYMLAEHGARDCGGPGGGSGGTWTGDAEVSAIMGHRKASEALGRTATRIMAAVIAGGMSLRGLADAIDEASNAYVAGMVVAALKRLSEHYGDLDSKTRG